MRKVLLILKDSKSLQAFLLYIALISLFYSPVVFFSKTLQPSLYQPHGVVEGWPYGYEGRKPVNVFNVNLGAAYNDWPKNKLIGDIYRQGDIPLWDPYRAAGTPLAAEYETRAFFPYQILQDISPVISWDYFLLGRLLLAGFFTYLFLALLGLSFPAAFLGGMFYMFSGTFVWFINFEYVTNISMMIPFLLYCIEVLIKKKGYSGTALSALAFGLVLLAGQPEIALYVLLFGASYFIFRIFAEYYNNLKRLILLHLKILLAFILGLGLSAMLIFPFLEFVKNSHNIHPPGGIMGITDPASFDYAISIITPTASEMPMDPDYITGRHGRVQDISGNPFYYTVFPSNGEWDYIGGYSGVSPVYLLLLGLFIVLFLKRHPYKGKLIFFAGFGVFILLKNYGVWPFELIGYLPFFDQVWSPRWANPVWTCSFAIAGAIGFDIAKDTFQEKVITEGSMPGRWYIRFFDRFNFKGISRFFGSTFFQTFKGISKNTIVFTLLYWFALAISYNGYKWWMKHILESPLTPAIKTSIKHTFPWLIFTMAVLYVCLTIWQKKRSSSISYKEYAYILIFQYIVINIVVYFKGWDLLVPLNLSVLFFISVIILAIWLQKITRLHLFTYKKTSVNNLPSINSLSMIRLFCNQDSKLIFILALIVFLILYNKFLRHYLFNIYPKISFIMWPYFIPSVLIGIIVSIGIAIIAALICIRYAKTGRGLYSLIFLSALELWYAIPRGYSSQWLYLKLIPLIFGLLVVWAALQAKWRLAIGGIFLFLISFSIIDFKAIHGFPDRYDPFTKAPYIDFLKNQEGYYRTVGGYGVLFPNFAGAMGIQDVRYINALAVAAYQGYREEYLHLDNLTRWNSSILWFTGRPELYVYKGGVDLPLYRRIEEDIRRNLRYYSLLGVKYILMPASKDMNKDIKYLGGPHFPLIYDKEIKIYENPDAFPRAFVSYDLEYANSYKEAQQIIKQKDFDLRHKVVLEENAPVWYKNETSPQDSDIFIRDYQPNRVAIDARLKCSGILVVSDVYYPGWEVYVDGVKMKIYRVDGLFRGVFLEQGRHEVIFKYMPMSFNIGASTTIISFMICVGLIVAGRKKLKVGADYEQRR